MSVGEYGYFISMNHFEFLELVKLANKTIIVSSSFLVLILKVTEFL